MEEYMLNPVKMKRELNSLFADAAIMKKSIQNGVFGAGVNHE